MKRSPRAGGNEERGCRYGERKATTSSEGDGRYYRIWESSNRLTLKIEVEIAALVSGLIHDARRAPRERD